MFLRVVYVFGRGMTLASYTTAKAAVQHGMLERQLSESKLLSNEREWMSPMVSERLG